MKKIMKHIRWMKNFATNNVIQMHCVAVIWRLVTIVVFANAVGMEQENIKEQDTPVLVFNFTSLPYLFDPNYWVIIWFLSNIFLRINFGNSVFCVSLKLMKKINKENSFSGNGKSWFHGTPFLFVVGQNI